MYSRRLAGVIRRYLYDVRWYSCPAALGVLNGMSADLRASSSMSLIHISPATWIGNSYVSPGTWTGNKLTGTIHFRPGTWKHVMKTDLN